MKVAIVSVFPPYRGGIARFNRHLYDNLIAEGHEVLAINFKRQYPSFIFPGVSQFSDSPQDPDIEAVMDTLSIRTWWRTATIINDSDIDTVIVPFWTSYLALPKIGFIKKLKKKRVISLAHNAIPHDSKRWQRALARRFFNQCHQHITLSEAVTADLQELCKQVDSSKIIPLFHPVYPSKKSCLSRVEACEHLGLDPSKKILLYFGLIRPYKGVELLVEAMEALGDDYQLIVAGEAYYSIDDLVLASARQGERIQWHTRFIPDDEVPVYFKAADVLVLPYRNATQSGVTAQGIYYGVPAIVSDVGGLSEYVEAGKTGLLFRPNNVRALVQAIQQWFDPQRSPAEVSAAIQNKAEKLSWKHFAERLTEHLNAQR